MTINDLAFNQDYSCLLLSTDEGHKIFNCEPFGEFYSLNVSSEGKYPTAFLRMLFSTSLTLIVPEMQGSTGNRILKIFNLKQNIKICELTFPLNIVDLMLNRKRLVVFLEAGQIYIYDLASMLLVKVLEIELLKPKLGADYGVVATLGADDRSLLVLPLMMINEQTDLFNSDSNHRPSTPHLRPSDSTFPTLLDSLVEFTQKDRHTLTQREGLSLQDLQRDSQGWLMVYDTIQLEPRLIYKAHDSQVARLAISNNSSLISSASTKGTIVRVAHLDHGDGAGRPHITQVTNLRRGHNPARILALRFDLAGAVLGCLSDSNTVHIFDLRGDSGEDDARDEDYSDGEGENAPSSGSRSLDDLNENLSNLLVQKPAPEHEEGGLLRLAWRRPSTLLNNPYARLFISKLPYRNYFDSLVWKKPKRSYAYVKVPEYMPANSRQKHLEMGFSATGVLLLSYSTGTFYHYQLPKPGGEREECLLVSRNSLL